MHAALILLVAALAGCGDDISKGDNNGIRITLDGGNNGGSDAGNNGGANNGGANNGGSDAGNNGTTDSGGNNGGSDAGNNGGADMDVTPTADEVDPNCIDGQYSEALPDPTADISSEKASYQSSQVESYIDDILEKRFPVGAWVVRQGLTNMNFQCVDQFLRDDSSAEAVIGSLSTVVHECGHIYDFTLGGFSEAGYGITPDLTITCSGGDTTERGGDTFARSRIRDDAYQSQRPPCNGGFGSDCDSYADTYLDGDPDDGNFDGGDQGFNSVLEETLQYVNSLATSYAFQDHVQGGTSAMDGILTFLWYVERYLRMARLDYPDAYARLKDDACWREAILTVWGRAWLMLEQAENIDKLGISEGQLFQLVRDPDLLGEIQRLRDAEGCN